MSGRSLCIAAIGWVCWAASVPAQTLPAPEQTRSYVRVDHPAASSEPPLVAILGEVRNPGAYRLERGELSELVDGAGGFTAEASRNLRVIRGGRGTQKVFLQPTTAFTLRSGDVIVAESTGLGRSDRHQARAATGPLVTGRSAHARVATPGVRVAALGLQAWPVVLSLSAENASAQGLLRVLNQPVRGKVVVISGGGVSKTVDVSAGAIPLASDSVIVFPAGTIEPALLPKLAEPQSLGVAAALPSETDNVPSAKVEILESPNRLPTADAIAELTPQPMDQPPVPDATSLPSEAAESELAKVLPQRTEPTPVDESRPPPTPDAAVPAPRERFRDPEPGWFQNLSAPLVFVSACALFLAILTTLGWVTQPAQAKSAAPPAALETAAAAMPPPVVADPLASVLTFESNRLELLIQNRLPLLEEPVTIAAVVRLPATPIEVSPRRVDPAQTLPDPHFPLEAARTPAAAPSADDTTARSLRVDRSHEGRPGLLDRVLATVQRDATQRDTADVKRI